MLFLQLPRFVVVGAAATALHVLVVVLMIETGVTGDAGPGLLAANGVAWAFAGLLSYLGHHRWTFRGEVGENHAHEFRLPRFLATSLLGLGGNLGAVLLLREVIGASYSLATTGGVTLSVIITFTLSKLWTFVSIEDASS